MDILNLRPEMSLISVEDAQYVLAWVRENMPNHVWDGETYSLGASRDDVELVSEYICEFERIDELIEKLQNKSEMYMMHDAYLATLIQGGNHDTLELLHERSTSENNFKRYKMRVTMEIDRSIYRLASGYVGDLNAVIGMCRHVVAAAGN